MKKILLKLLNPLVLQLVKDEMAKQTMVITKDVMKLVKEELNHRDFAQIMTEDKFLQLLNSGSSLH